MTNQIAVAKNGREFEIVNYNENKVTIQNGDDVREMLVTSLKKNYKVVTVEVKEVVVTDAEVNVAGYITEMEEVLNTITLTKDNKKWRAGYLYAAGYSIQQIAKYFGVTGPQIRVYLVYLGLYEPGTGTAQYNKYVDGVTRFRSYFIAD